MGAQNYQKNAETSSVNFYVQLVGLKYVSPGSNKSKNIMVDFESITISRKRRPSKQTKT